MLPSYDYYVALGVDRKSSQDEIKRAYRKRVVACHPDQNPDDSKAEEEFKKISEAYGILGDEEKRKHYDVVAGFMGSQADGGEALINEFVQAFGQIIKDVRKDIDLEMETSPKRPTKRAKKTAKNEDEGFVMLRQGGMTFRVQKG